MKKANIISAITFLMLAALTYGILVNSHIDIFPGMEYDYDYFTETHTADSGFISLLDASYGTSLYGSYAKLTAMGYIVAALVIVGIPGAIAVLLRKKLIAKQG